MWLNYQYIYIVWTINGDKIDKLINQLINCAEKYNIDIIDDSENHDMIFIGFPSPATISCGDVNFMNVREIKYTHTHEYVICHEDDLDIFQMKNQYQE